MVAYLVNQIVLGKLDYTYVTVTKRPDLKTEIDDYIAQNNIQIPAL